jgi:hypothetical protein
MNSNQPFTDLQLYRDFINLFDRIHSFLGRDECPDIESQLRSVITIKSLNNNRMSMLCEKNTCGYIGDEGRESLYRLCDVVYDSKKHTSRENLIYVIEVGDIIGSGLRIKDLIKLGIGACILKKFFRISDINGLIQLGFKLGDVRRKNSRILFTIGHLVLLFGINWKILHENKLVKLSVLRRIYIKPEEYITLSLNIDDMRNLSSHPYKKIDQQLLGQFNLTQELCISHFGGSASDFTGSIKLYNIKKNTNKF